MKDIKRELLLALDKLENKDFVNKMQLAQSKYIDGKAAEKLCDFLERCYSQKIEL